jgi:hypothetical protein
MVFTTHILDTVARLSDDFHEVMDFYLEHGDYPRQCHPNRKKTCGGRAGTLVERSLKDEKVSAVRVVRRDKRLKGASAHLCWRWPFARLRR